MVGTPTNGGLQVTISSPLVSSSKRRSALPILIFITDIVLPNGTFATVSETEGSEIFYALQGGVNNFGIVTSFTLKTFPIGKVWGGTIYYPSDQIDALVDAAVEYAAKPSVPKATLATEFFANNGTLEGAASKFPSSA
jgi:FAD/FMN-containing dehydrogenase